MSSIYQRNVPLSPYTTLGLGGCAQFFCNCTSLDEIRQGLLWARERNMPVQVMGGGSNLIYPDEGFSGLVMKIGLQGVRFEDRGEECVVGVQAGQDWDRLVQASVERGLGGVECLSGIPGLVGATPMQNVGAYGQEVKDVITVVRALERETLQMVEFERQACGFAYRQSRFKNEDLGRYIIVEVEYCLKKEARPQLHYAELQRYVEEKVDIEGLESDAALQAVRQAVLELRRGKSMVVDAADPNARSAGSFFLNPVVSKQQFGAIEDRWAAMGGEGAVPSFDAAEGVKVPAAWLVERAGFAKGYRRGGVGVSEKHALALVNWGGTTQELLQLAEQICRGVEEKFGVRLEREPVVVEWES